MCGEICGDNRFEIIADAKKKLIEATNIETSQNEMDVLDSILFRMWQMKWLPGCVDAEPIVRCKDCKHAPREEIIDGKHYIIEPKDEDGTTDSTCPYVCMDWYYTEVPDDDSFCDKGERKDGEQDEAD